MEKTDKGVSVITFYIVEQTRSEFVSKSFDSCSMVLFQFGRLGVRKEGMEYSFCLFCYLDSRTNIIIFINAFEILTTF